MNTKDKTQNSIRNSAFGIASQIVIILISFFTRSIFLKYLSEEYLGLNGLFSNVISILSLTELGFGQVPVCMAKTQYSLSDDAKKLGRPTGFRITVRDAYVSAGAGFVVCLTGDIMTMPGLPKKPAAFGIDVNDGKITGLF